MFTGTKSKRYKSRRKRRAKKHTLFVNYSDNKKTGLSLSLPSFSVLKKAVCIFMVLFCVLPTTKLLGESTVNFFTEDTFNLKSFEVINNLLYSRDEILKIAQVKEEGSVFDIDINEIKNKIESDSNIAQAIVVRVIPNKISIKVYEKMPLMIAVSGEKEYFVDKNGEILSWKKSRIKSILPKVEGLSVNGFGEKHEILKTIFEIYDSYNHHVALKDALGFEKFKIYDQYRIEMKLTEKRSIYLGQDIDFDKSFSKLDLVYEDIKLKEKSFKSIDLRFKDVVVKGLK